jgi:DNA-binding MarR family transcriptional regulator
MVRTQSIRLEQEVTRLISRVFIHLDDSDRQLMKHFGLTTTQFWALVHLEDAEGRSLSELANLLICDKSNVTSIVDKMEEMGLAERKPGKAGDRRYTRVVLTPEGRELRNRSIVARERLIESRLGVLNRDILSQLVSPLQQLADALQTQFDNNDVVDIIEASIDQSRIPV